MQDFENTESWKVKLQRVKVKLQQFGIASQFSSFVPYFAAFTINKLESL